MSHRRKEFVVYPPNYQPGDGFIKVRTVKAAKKQCRKYGIGSSVMPWIHQHPSRCKPWQTSWTMNLWEYGS